MTHRSSVAATPDGTDTIQRAIDALDGPGVVYLPPGQFRLTRTVRLPSDVALVGAGTERTFLTLEPGSNCHVFTNTDHNGGNETIELRGFTLDGNLHDQHKPDDLKGITFACGGYFRHTTGLVVRDVVARRIRQTAFHFSTCSHVVVDGLHAEELGWSGVSTSGTDDIVLRRLLIVDSGLDVRHSGIHLDGGTGAFIDAVVDRSTGNGIMLDSKFAPMHDAVVQGAAHRCLRGVSLSGDHVNGMTHVLVSGDFSENTECGVNIANTSYVFVSDATIASNGEAGVLVQGRDMSTNCVLTRCRITGNPKAIVERDQNRIASIIESVVHDGAEAAEPIAVAPPPQSAHEPTTPTTAPATAPANTGAAAATAGAASTPPPTPTPTPTPSLPPRLHPRRAVRGLSRRVSRATARFTSDADPRPEPAPATTAPAAPAPAPAPATATAPADDDAFDGVCNVCGTQQTFVRKNASLREGYRCMNCKASLRYRGQADAILRTYSANGTTCIADLARDPAFAALSFWEPGVLGPFRQYFSSLPNYVVSDFWPDVAPGDSRDGVRCEDLQALTFADESFDLVVTSDIFEHVRKPDVGFSEVGRVLRSGGRHIFSIPVQEPMRQRTLERVDTSGDDDVYLEEPRYHLGPGNSQHLVYNDFGVDLIDRLRVIGFDTEIVRFEAPSAEASRLLTFVSVKR